MLKQIEGSQAVAEAIALCRPEVICAYPITPQTQIVEELSEMCADGRLAARFIKVESEHSAMAACRWCKSLLALLVNVCASINRNPELLPESIARIPASIFGSRAGPLGVAGGAEASSRCSGLGALDSVSITRASCASPPVAPISQRCNISRSCSKSNGLLK